jgi:hypothetical protein
VWIRQRRQAPREGKRQQGAALPQHEWEEESTTEDAMGLREIRIAWVD